MPEQADLDLQKLSRLRVLHLERTADAKLLAQRWAYFNAQQHDHAPYDFDFRARQRGLTYMQQRQLGYESIPNAIAKDAPVGSRRPSTPSSLIGEIVETYTAALLGPERRPTISVVGDPDSSQVLQQLFGANWDAMVEVRQRSGAQGCSAFLVWFDNGKVEIQGLVPQDLYVEWSAAPGWIPRLVIEQKLVEERFIDPESGTVGSKRVWRTRAWDEVYAYEYNDVPEDFGAPKDTGGSSQRATAREYIELAGPPIEHKAGRCPVVWLPNTHSSEDHIGEPDVPPVSCEQADQLDILSSMVTRATRANMDPTLVIKDRLIERRMWPMRAKGFGQKIEVSEVGDAQLLEMSGKTVEVALAWVQRLEDAIQSRTGHLVIKPDQAGAMQSGVALQILGRTQANRIAVRRGPLGNAITQAAEIMLSFVRAVGIKAKSATGPGIELAPIEVGDDDDDEKTFELPKLGQGRAVAVVWGALHHPTPADLSSLAQSGTMATGGRPIVSQRTAVSMFAALGQTGVDPETEIERLHEEQEQRVASFESSMTPEADGELEDAIGKAKQAPEQDVAANAEGKAKDVQATALNGAQVQALAALLGQAGVTLAPDVVARLQTRAFQIPANEAKANVDDQVAFLATLPKPGEVEPTAPDKPVNQPPPAPIEGA